MMMILLDGHDGKSTITIDGEIDVANAVVRDAKQNDRIEKIQVWKPGQDPEQYWVREFGTGWVSRIPIVHPNYVHPNYE